MLITQWVQICNILVWVTINIKYDLSFYRDCNGPGAPTNPILTATNAACGNTTINIPLTMVTNVPCQLGGFSGTTGCEVSPLCPQFIGQSSCNSSPGSYKGIQSFEYVGTVTLPSVCSRWLLRFNLCCRNASNNIANSTAQDLSIEAMINNTINPVTGLPYCNNSATFSELPVPFKCSGVATTYNHGAVEPDGDSLRYFLTNPLGNNFIPITNYNGGYSPIQPVRTTPVNSFTFDQTSGQMGFTPSSIETDVLAVRVEEYRNGVLIGYTMRDVQVEIINCNVSTPDFATNIDSLNNATLIDSVTLQACPGTPVSFSILGVDRLGKTLTITSTLQAGTNSPLPGATFTTQNVGTAPFDSVRARITWTPAVSDTGCKTFLVTLKNNDCPIQGTRARVFKACVLNKVTVTPHTAVYCGTPIQLTSTGGSNFTWSPTAGLNNANSYTPLASPVVNTTYKFTSDCGTDSAVITVNPPFAIDAGTGGQICRNGQLQINASLASTYAPYQVVWVPSNGLLDPITGLPTSSSLNPVASPSSTTLYTMFATGANGCVRTDTVSVRVAGIAPAIVASANPTSVCPGTPVQLRIVANPTNCGIPLAPCTGNIRNVDIGTDATIQGGGGTIYPSIYGQNKKSARHQMLIKASELTAQLGAGGQINSIQFDIGTLNSSPTFQNFTISLACATQDSLTSFVGGLTQVFNPKNIVPVLGANNHIFDQPYDWDGVSDLIVDVCFSGTTSGTINNKLKYSTTSYRSLWFSADNTSTACGVTGVYTVAAYSFYFQRPNMRFNVCQATLDNANIAWTPATGPNAPTPLNNDTVTATPVSPTRYVASVSDNGCIGNDFVFVNVDTSLRLTVTPDTFICSINPIRLIANMQGSPLPGSQFTYTWTASVGAAPPSGAGASFATAIVNPTQPTAYICVVTGGACIKTDTALVVIGNGLPVSIRFDSILCNGANNGKAFALKQGGVSPFTYQWSPNLSATDSIVGLSPNTYSVTITDNVGCSGSATATLSQPPLLTLVMDSVNIRCNGLANGQVSATVAGGTQPYTYVWSPVQPNIGTLTNLAPGPYAVTVTDRNGCSLSGARNVTQPSPLTTSTQAFAISANGGSDGKARVFANGGVGPYTYTWSPGGGTLDSITNKPKGTYYVIVCDANNCCKTDSAIITDPPPIILTFQTTNNLCFGDSIGTASVSAVGGVLPYTFTWSTGTVGTSIVGLKAGAYTVTVADSNNVTVQGSVNITQPTQISISFDSVSVRCFGGNNGSLTANATGGTGGYTYTWSNGAGNVMTATGLIAQSHTVTVTDANGCTSSATKTLFQPALLNATLVSTDSTSCFGTADGSATINVVGGTPNYTYNWSIPSAPNAPIASVFPAGLQGVLVTDQNGCTDTVIFNIQQPAQIGLAVATTNANCATSNDGTATATVNGGTAPYTYTWDGTMGANPKTALGSGNHSVTVTDDNGCSVSSAFVIDTNYVLHLSISKTDALCNGAADGSATVVALNGIPNYTYQWNVPGNTATIPSAAQSLTATVTDNVGCEASISTTVGEPSAIVLTTGNLPPSCNGKGDGKAWVGATGGTGGYAYSWSNNSSSDTIRNIVASVYTVTVRDANQCSATEVVNVFNPLSLTASFIKTEITCFDAADGAGTVVASGGTPPYRYVWSDNFVGDVRTPVAPGAYQITVSDNNKCDTVLNVLYSAPPGIEFIAINLDSISCPRTSDGQILIDVAGGTPGNIIPYTYSIDGINYQTSRLFDNLAAGPHRIWVKDGNNCVKDTIVVIESPQELVFYIEPQDSGVVLGKSLQLNILTNNFPSGKIQSYAWSTSDGLSCVDCPNPVASPYNTTDYTLSVYYGENCLATNVVTVNVGKEPDYYMPNAFSPNGDSKNERISVYGSGLKTVHLTIFNRWGEKVYESVNQSEGWDGTYKGQQQSPGLYTYMADLEYLNGKKKRDFGSITLIR
jgi:gliding motility-associated-like protein